MLDGQISAPEAGTPCEAGFQPSGRHRRARTDCYASVGVAGKMRVKRVLGCFEKVIVVREGKRTALDNEFKYYAFGVGQILNEPRDASRHENFEERGSGPG